MEISWEQRLLQSVRRQTVTTSISSNNGFKRGKNMTGLLWVVSILVEFWAFKALAYLSHCIWGPLKLYLSRPFTSESVIRGLFRVLRLLEMSSRGCFLFIWLNPKLNNKCGNFGSSMLHSDISVCLLWPKSWSGLTVHLLHVSSLSFLLSLWCVECILAFAFDNNYIVLVRLRNDYLKAVDGIKKHLLRFTPRSGLAYVGSYSDWYSRHFRTVMVSQCHILLNWEIVIVANWHYLIGQQIYRRLFFLLIGCWPFDLLISDWLMVDDSWIINLWLVIFYHWIYL